PCPCRRAGTARRRSRRGRRRGAAALAETGSNRRVGVPTRRSRRLLQDRKSTRLNSSHVKSSYAVFCLKKTITSRNSCSPCVGGRVILTDGALTTMNHDVRSYI